MFCTLDRDCTIVRKMSSKKVERGRLEFLIEPEESNLVITDERFDIEELEVLMITIFSFQYEERLG